jgi:AraC-like DNA-binding protein
MYSYYPKPPLSVYVQQIWLQTGDVPVHAKERVLPSGTMEIVINLRRDKLSLYERTNPAQTLDFRGMLVCGVHSEYFVIDTASQAEIMGIHFRAGGAFPFFNLPTDELRNLHVSLADLWGTAADFLYEQLLSAPTHQAKFRVIERFLTARLVRPLSPHPAVSFALKELPYSRTIGDLSEKIGLSERRFIQLFSQEVGLTPKLFWRVQRFQKVLTMLKKAQTVDWLALALDCNYFDQAHFIHDFQAFAGINPTAYLNQRTEHHNHVPLQL